MFKVVCIKSDNSELYGRALDRKEFVSEGSVYTVTEIRNHRGAEWYMLKEKPYNIAYYSKNFIPLSNIDETEFIREHLTETV